MTYRPILLTFVLAGVLLGKGLGQDAALPRPDTDARVQDPSLGVDAHKSSTSPTPKATKTSTTYEWYTGAPSSHGIVYDLANPTSDYYLRAATLNGSRRSEPSLVTVEVGGHKVEVLLDGRKPTVLVDGTAISCKTKDKSHVLAAKTKDAAVCVDFAPKNTARFHPRKMRRYIGINIGSVDSLTAAQLGLDPQKCFVVLDTVESMPAAKYGLKKHDIITHIEGKRPATRERLKKKLATLDAGHPIRLRLVRSAKSFDVDVHPSEYPENTIRYRDTDNDGDLDLLVNPPSNTPPTTFYPRTAGDGSYMFLDTPPIDGTTTTTSNGVIAMTDPRLRGVAVDALVDGRANLARSGVWLHSVPPGHLVLPKPTPKKKGKKGVASAAKELQAEFARLRQQIERLEQMIATREAKRKKSIK